MIVDEAQVVTEVKAAFERYEAALMADDVTAMDALFHDADSTIRYGVGEVLYGADEIRAFRKARGGSLQRRLGRVAIHAFGLDFATAHAEFFRDGTAARGRQSQSWVRFTDGWKIICAHVSIEEARS